MSWQVVMTISDTSEAIVRVLAKNLRDEWLGPGNPDLDGPIGVKIEVREVVDAGSPDSP